MGSVPRSLDGLLEALSSCFDTESARRLEAFDIDPELQARIQELAERANEGTLSDEERAEYQSFIDASDLISILQLKVSRRLKANGG